MKPYRHLKDSEPVWPDNSVYFLTESTFLHFPFFSSDDQKRVALEQIKKLNTKLGIPVSAYSIAKNHLHVKFFLKEGSDFGRVKQLLRGGISFEYRKRFKSPYEQMWQSRKTLILQGEAIDWKVTAYINGNLLKHQELGSFTDLYESRYSSYSYYVDKYGEAEVNDAIRRVFVSDEDEWGGIDMERLDAI